MAIPLTTEPGSALDRDQLQILERKARRFWICFIVSLLGLQITIGGTSIYLANSDSTVAIVPNYYQSAVNWDVTRRSLHLTEELGFAVNCEVGSAQDGLRLLTVSIADKEASPIPTLRLFAECFHHARAGEIRYLSLVESAPGQYSAPVPIEKSGLWQVNVRIEGPHGIAAAKKEVWVR